jgi:hypothetical protein
LAQFSIDPEGEVEKKDSHKEAGKWTVFISHKKSVKDLVIDHFGETPKYCFL